MHEHTGPGPRASTLGAWDSSIDGLYTLKVTDNLGSASAKDSEVQDYVKAARMLRGRSGWEREHSLRGKQRGEPLI